MGNIISSFFSGFTQAMANFLALHWIFFLGSPAVQFVDRHGIFHVTLRISVLPICSRWPWYYFCPTLLSCSSI
ncbi:hypothetical protein SLA2020_466640 [Shorea laevis]